MMPNSSKVIDSEMMQIQLDQLSQTLEVMTGTVQRLQRQVAVYEGASQECQDKPVLNEVVSDLQADRAAPLGALERDFRQSSKQRQAARIIKHLREDIRKTSPLQRMPSSRIIECLIKSCPAELMNGDSWQMTIIDILNYLLDATADDECLWASFTCHDQCTPLFPSYENFDEQDCHLFCDSLLNYLTNELQVTH